MFDMLSSLRSRELEGLVASLDKSQAIIHFLPDGSVIWANDNFLTVFGYSLAEIQGQHHSLFVDADHVRSAAYRQFWERLRRGEFQSALFKRIGKGGREVWIQASYNPIVDRAGKVAKVIKLATDVTEQVLQDAEHKGQIDAIGKSQAVVHFNLDGTIIWANDNFLSALGYPLAEVRGKHHGMFVDAAQRNSADYTRFWQRLAAGEFQAGEFKRIAKDGREVWIQASYNPILDPSGRPFRVVKFATDVTAQVRKRIESDRIGGEVDESLGKIVDAVGTINRRSSDASAASNEGASMMQTVASAAEEMSASVREIAETMAACKAAVDTVVGQTIAAEQATGELSKTSVSMSGIVELIQAIAAQIKLLALNATIEAARAGAAGTGFAVVATEVKELATQVAKAAENISMEIEAAQRVSGQVVGAIGTIKVSMDTVERSVAGAAGAVEEQTAATREISSSMQVASESVASINSALTEIVTSLQLAHRLASDSKELYTALRRI